MRFTRRQAEESIPTVPDDTIERLEALAHSMDELDNLRSETQHVENLAQSMRGHLAANHFIERLKASYGSPATGKGN